MSARQSGTQSRQLIPEASRAEIRKRLGHPSLALVNVLPREAFDAAHIPTSINLPFSQMNEQVREVLPDLSQDIVVYCGGFT